MRSKRSVQPRSGERLIETTCLYVDQSCLRSWWCVNVAPPITAWAVLTSRMFGLIRMQPDSRRDRSSSVSIQRCSS